MIDKKLKLFIDSMILAGIALDELTEDQIQEWYGSDYFNDLRRFTSWEGLNHYRNITDKRGNN